MSMLQQFAQQQPEFPLERFVEVANDLLPQFLPDSAAGGRGQEPVNPRLVRHYTTQGWLDKPIRQGREVRYGYRHLLQLLVLRRLLADGYSVSSIGSLVGEKADAELETILQGGVQLTVEAANPALAFLSKIRDRPPSQARSAKRSAPPYPAVGASSPAPPAPPAQEASSSPETWTHLEILEGVELHIRQDVVLPATAHEREQLLMLIADRLNTLTSSRRTPP